MTTLVTPKVNPDIDGVAAAIAYASIYPAEAVFFGELQPEPTFVLKKLGINVEMNVERVWDKFVLVDASSLRGMPEVIRGEDVIEVIDHRRVDLAQVKKLFPNARIQIELVGAAVTLVAERFREQPTRELATIIYCAIISNTLNLKSRTTTDRDLRVLKQMKTIAPEAEEIAREMLSFKTRWISKNLERAIVMDFKWWEDFGIAQLEVFGAEEIIDRMDEVVSILKDLQRSKSLQHIILNLADIKRGKSYFVFPSENDFQFFRPFLKAEKLSKNLAEGPIILRKEILANMHATW